MSRLNGLLLALATGAVSWFVYAWFAAKVGSPEPSWVASVLLLTVGFHELCHWAMMEKNGLKAHIFILVILGGAFPDPSQTKRYERLAWEKKSEIVMAGVIGNVILMVAAIVGHTFGLVSDDHLGKFIQLNAGVVLYNLLPIGFLDGGRFAKLLFDSVPEIRDGAFVRIIIAVTMICALVSYSLFHSYPFITLMLVFYGTYKNAADDDPHGSQDARAMTMAQCSTWTSVYLGLVAVGMLLVYATQGYNPFK